MLGGFPGFGNWYLVLCSLGIGKWNKVICDTVVSCLPTSPFSVQNSFVNLSIDPIQERCYLSSLLLVVGSSALICQGMTSFVVIYLDRIVFLEIVACCLSSVFKIFL